MSAHRLQALKGKRVLLLQGPMGPFFWRLARDLHWLGAKVCKVNFNGGDCLFYPLGALAYRGRMNEWPAFLDRLLVVRQVEVVLLLGDCRPIHAQVHAIATRHGVNVGVFEEGYVRPDYITLETAGVNGFSPIPRTPIFYLNTPGRPYTEPAKVNKSFGYAMLWAVLYYLASALLRPWFRHYRHHRPLTLREAWPWLRAFWRKAFFRVRERGIEASLCSAHSGSYFLVPLQVHNDAQIRVHSPYSSITDFISEVLESFAGNAPSSSILVFKHHPLDRGYREYGRPIRLQAEALGIAGRVMVIHDQHLPSLLAHARGVVVINSTVGFSAVHHDTPVKVCGSANYDMQGLTFQGSLDEFWSRAGAERIDRELYLRFRNYLIGKTQLNGSFYKRLDIPGSHTGLVWQNADGPGVLDSLADVCRQSSAESAEYTE